MAFRDFGFPDVQQALGLTLAEADLFSRIPALELPTAFVEWMRSGIDLALAIAMNDNLRPGLGQCIAAMVAAREFNAQSSASVAAVYGVVTTGAAWKFLRLEGVCATLDVPEYFVAELGRILGILSHMLRAG